MRYLVTGATGLVGNNVVRQLLDAGHAVRVLARGTSDPRPLEGLAVERVAGDVRDGSALAQACAGVDVVVHSAGHVYIGWTGLEDHRAVNVVGTRNVAAAARQAGARLVHVSSVNALGLGRLESPAGEETALPGIVPVPYVVTKREAEQVVLEEVDRGLWATIVNPAMMFGPWDWKPSSGQMLVEVSQGSLFAPVGAQNVCDVRDVAAGTIAAAERGACGRRYILGGYNLSYRDLWTRIAALAGRSGPRLPMGPVFRAIAAPLLSARTRLTGRESPANAGALAMSGQSHCFTSARAQRELGYRIRPLDETLADAWQWLREHGYIKTRRTQ